jgi:hypothetical protein
VWNLHAVISKTSEGFSPQQSPVTNLVILSRRGQSRNVRDVFVMWFDNLEKETSSLMTKSIQNDKHALPIVAQQYHVTIQNENAHLEVETDDKYALHTLTTITATTPITIRKSNAMIHLSVATCIKGLTFRCTAGIGDTPHVCLPVCQSASISDLDPLLLCTVTTVP